MIVTDWERSRAAGVCVHDQLPSGRRMTVPSDADSVTVSAATSNQRPEFMSGCSTTPLTVSAVALTSGAALVAVKLKLVADEIPAVSMAVIVTVVVVTYGMFQTLAWIMA